MMFSKFTLPYFSLIFSLADRDIRIPAVFPASRSSIFVNPMPDASAMSPHASLLNTAAWGWYAQAFRYVRISPDVMVRMVTDTVLPLTVNFSRLKFRATARARRLPP